ncbi:Uncharacterised protein [Enterobacter hormaechei]|nr:Uncharacterised protein [Enterobacter hormaechei]VAM23542.1 Uncharacterised protein [Enterobacter hormaechei]
MIWCQCAKCGKQQSYGNVMSGSCRYCNSNVILKLVAGNKKPDWFKGEGFQESPQNEEKP